MGYNDGETNTLYGGGCTTIHIRPSGMDPQNGYEILGAGRVVGVRQKRHITILSLDCHEAIPDSDVAVLVACEFPDTGREHLILWQDRVYELLDGINRMVPPEYDDIYS